VQQKDLLRSEQALTFLPRSKMSFSRPTSESSTATISLPVFRIGMLWLAQYSYVLRLPSTHSSAFLLPLTHRWTSSSRRAQRQKNTERREIICLEMEC